MELYKIKPEAKHFFDKKLADQIKPLSYFTDKNISVNALLNVDRVYLTYGIKENDILTNICGWSGVRQEAKFHFTINVNEVKNEVYHIIKDDKLMLVLMDKMQSVINSHINENLPF